MLFRVSVSVVSEDSNKESCSWTLNTWRWRHPVSSKRRERSCSMWKERSLTNRRIYAACRRSAQNDPFRGLTECRYDWALQHLQQHHSTWQLSAPPPTFSVLFTKRTVTELRVEVSRCLAVPRWAQQRPRRADCSQSSVRNWSDHCYMHRQYAAGQTSVTAAGCLNKSGRWPDPLDCLPCGGQDAARRVSGRSMDAFANDEY